MTIFGNAESTGIVLNLGSGITTVTLNGASPIHLNDSDDSNGIVGNAGNNVITVSGGVDAVDGGMGEDRLVVDYRAATGAVTGDNTSSFAEEGGGGRLVTITDRTIEHFTILTGSGADTITTGAGDDIIRTGKGASTVSAGQGANTIVGGKNADTVTALDGGNLIRAGNGANTVTTGSGMDSIHSGNGSDTIVSGAGDDRVFLTGGADIVDAGAGRDRLIIDYSAMTSDVVGGVTTGNANAGYAGHLADQLGNMIDFEGSEAFNIISGSGNDTINTRSGLDVLRGGAGDDVLRSGNSADQLYGGRGDDVLTGGLGTDRLSGGAGADVFVFLTTNESRFGGGKDTIVDFKSGTDQIDLVAIDADAGTVGDQSFVFIGSAQFSSVAGELRYINGLVRGDVNGDGVGDFEIAIGEVSGLNQNDFVL